jgi:hypothetical protein
LTPNHAIADNIHFAKKQTPLASQYGQINTIKKDNTCIDTRKKHKLDKISLPIVDPPTKNSREKVTKQKPICYKCKKIGHYQNNYVYIYIYIYIYIFRKCDKRRKVSFYLYRDKMAYYHGSCRQNILNSNFVNYKCV